jgi:hypothetical protein
MEIVVPIQTWGAITITWRNIQHTLLIAQPDKAAPTLTQADWGLK